jgi:hypothetical protein
LFGVSATTFHEQFLVSGIHGGVDNVKGATYLFDQSGNLIRSFPSPSSSTEDGFGTHVAAIGDLVAVSAIVDDSQATHSGLVYLFNGNTGQLLRTILNPHPRAEDRFGISLAAFGNNLVIGSTGGTTGSGAAYIFDPTTGNLVREFDNPTPAAGDSFGSAVATIGNDLRIGAHFDDTLGTDVGSVYRFNGLTGELLSTLADPAPNGKDNFGWSIGVTGNTVAIGAPLRSLVLGDITSTEEGAVYLFDSDLHYFGMITGTHGDNQERFGMVIVGAGSDLLLGDQTGDGFHTQDAGRA